jgi:hypothetical protein
MTGVKPIYIKLLIAAIAIFIIGTALALSDIYYKLGRIEHFLICKDPSCHHRLEGAR